MNLSSPFIRRPVATTLLTAAIALAGGVAFGCCRCRRCPRSIFPPSPWPHLAGSQPGDHGFVGGHSSRTPIRPHRRRDGNDLVQLPGNDRRSRCNSI